jgi:hypothetical protein
MKLTAALGIIKGSEKTASADAPAATAPAGSASSSTSSERLKLALAEAIAPAPTKTASAPSPVEDLTKIAADLSKAEHEAITKEAQLYGAALCDGFMARAAQYTKAAAVAGPAPTAKVASAHSEDVSFEKFASENQELVKQAAELGFTTTTQQLEKLAEASYAKGWNVAVAALHKAASDCFVAGFKDTLAIMETAR